ncbi:Aminotransferase class I and II family protein [Aspergillus niger]|uniref:Aminotransferase class I and II family protein n=1 Tax=Aspergillus niger TaxID=5061 RepID=A0A505I8Q5_ASPNG|nr:Aminotransferase class I and II family protein [Aspergillus niger]
MPPLSGEERILTVFADIHYYFAAPCPKPLHHRFDKGCYLYLYLNSALQKVRIEVANNPGTPEQDAFNGALDNIHLRHSTKFPTLCTVTVDGQVPSPPPGQPAFPPPPGAISSEWQLPGNDSPALFRLHTLDIYFWTTEDVNQFLDLIERHLSQSQIETDRHPFPPPPQSTVSSVVQQLENVAITDPGYQNGQTRNSQAEVVSNPVPSYQAITPPSNLPPPPPLGGLATTAQPVMPGIQTVASEQQDNAPPEPTPAPLPYNPAAPPAPEPIRHREKTPPPDDAETGTGLAAAAAAAVDNGLAYPQSSQMPQGLAATATAPSATRGLSAPPPPPGPAPPYSMPGNYVPPGPPSAGLSSFPTSLPSPGAGAGPTPGIYRTSTDSSSTSTPPMQLSLGGYSNYSYEQPGTKRSATVSGNEYNVHNQLYQPTAQESISPHQKYAKEAMVKPGDPHRPQYFVKSAYKVEHGVNRFLKKLEKRL